MANLESLLNDLANLDAQHDLDGMRQVREQIVDSHPKSDAAVESLYKIGLDFLFRQRDIMAAVQSFETAAKHKHPFWSAAARTSLGLCYYHQKRTQKAFFELRKVAYPSEPNDHSITALTFLENIFEEEGKLDDAAKIRKDKIRQLGKLVKMDASSNASVSARGYHLFQLGIAYRDQDDDDKGRDLLEQCKAMGPEALGADLYRSVVDALG